jgi:hypothetical protein
MEVVELGALGSHALGAGLEGTAVRAMLGMALLGG